GPRRAPHTGRGGPRGSRAAGPRGRRQPWSVLGRLGRQGGHERVVLVDLADLGRAARRPEVVEELDVRLVVVLPLLRDVVLVEDRLDGADRFARTAVDALVGMDVEHPLALVDAVDGALVDAGAVEDVDARQ